MFRYRVGKSSETLIPIIATMFPGLLAMAESLIQNDSIEAATMLTTIFKSYFDAIHFKLNEYFQNPACMQSWTEVMLQALRKPDFSERMSEEEREKHQWWKVKKWAMHCLNKIFTRYGNPALLSSADTKKYKAFSNWYVSNIAVQVLKVYLEFIDAHLKGCWISSRCKAHLVNYLSDALRHKTTWSVMKPVAHVIIQQFIFPLLCHSQEDERLWNEDPVDYINQKLDPMDDYRSHIAGSMNLVMELSRDRSKVVFLPLLQFINEIAMRYLDTPAEQRNYAEKDGALMLIGLISNQTIGKVYIFCSQIEIASKKSNGGVYDDPCRP